MQAPPESFPVLAFIGVVIQMGGALLLITLFGLLRRFALRRAYFAVWGAAWTAVAIAIAAIVIRYILMPQIIGSSLDERHPVTLALYFVYQTCNIGSLLSQSLGFLGCPTILLGIDEFLSNFFNRPADERVGQLNEFVARIQTH